MEVIRYSSYTVKYCKSNMHKYIYIYFFYGPCEISRPLSSENEYVYDDGGVDDDDSDDKNKFTTS